MLVLATSALAQESKSPVRFAAIDIMIDPHGHPLGAYQIDFRATSGDVKLVGVEGGDAEAFAKAPYYDPAALQQSRIVVAAYSTASNLPNQSTRIARLHVQITGDVKPDYELKLIVAGDAQAKPIEAAASFAPFKQ